jgi:hypothetical protein
MVSAALQIFTTALKNPKAWTSLAKLAGKAKPVAQAIPSIIGKVDDAAPVIRKVVAPVFKKIGDAAPVIRKAAGSILKKAPKRPKLKKALKSGLLRPKLKEANTPWSKLNKVFGHALTALNVITIGSSVGPMLVNGVKGLLAGQKTNPALEKAFDALPPETSTTLKQILADDTLTDEQKTAKAQELVDQGAMTVAQWDNINAAAKPVQGNNTPAEPEAAQGNGGNPNPPQAQPVAETPDPTTQEEPIQLSNPESTKQAINAFAADKTKLASFTQNASEVFAVANESKQVEKIQLEGDTTNTQIYMAAQNDTTVLIAAETPTSNANNKIVSFAQATVKNDGNLGFSRTVAYRSQQGTPTAINKPLPSQPLTNLDELIALNQSLKA